MNVQDFITYVKNADDVPYVRNQLLDVNMRLFNNKKNHVYRTIVQNCCEYIRFVALQTMDGYTKPYGMSGANLAIPFNIIGVVRNRNTTAEYCEVMINPKIIRASKEKTEASSNCGSIRLNEPIKIMRSDKVTVEWYDEAGLQQMAIFDRIDGGFTIQHEVEHNMGILITDLVDGTNPF